MQRAYQVPTALWFSKSDELPDLVCAGQATACFNLLQTMARQRRSDRSAEAMASLEARARSLWSQLLADPRVLLAERVGARLAPAAFAAGPRAQLLGS